MYSETECLNVSSLRTCRCLPPNRNAHHPVCKRDLTITPKVTHRSNPRNPYIHVSSTAPTPNYVTLRCRIATRWRVLWPHGRRVTTPAKCTSFYMFVGCLQNDIPGLAANLRSGWPLLDSMVPARDPKQSEYLRNQGAAYSRQSHDQLLV